MDAERISPDSLRAFGTQVLAALGVPEADGALVADSLVQADLWGHQSHGFLRLPWYAARIRTGAMRAVTDPAVLSDTGPLLLLDGRDGIGQVLTERARRLAVERARTHGVGVVGVRNSNHFGTAMYFTRRAAADGCVAVLTTNASPAMAPWGGREKRLGTNPWSIAAPGPDGRVVAVDIANTAVARGKIYLAKNRGEPIPETWALSRGRGADDRPGGRGARRDPADGRPQGLCDHVPDGRAVRRPDRQRRRHRGARALRGRPAQRLRPPVPRPRPRGLRRPRRVRGPRAAADHRGEGRPPRAGVRRGLLPRRGGGPGRGGEPGRRRRRPRRAVPGRSPRAGAPRPACRSRRRQPR